MISPKLIKQMVAQWSNYFLLTHCIAIYEMSRETYTDTHTETHAFFFSILVTDNFFFPF